MAPGNYVIRVTDNAGCFYDVNATVGADPGVSASALPQNSTCATIPNGNITVTVTSGVAPFTYSSNTINGGAAQNSNLFGNLLVGTYTIQVKDNVGCTNTVTATVNNDPKVMVNSFDLVAPSCFGLVDGSITIHASMGAAPYQYAIGSGAYQTNNVLTNLPVGNAVIHVKDNYGCILDTFSVLTQPALLTATADTIAATCTGNPDGQLTIHASGGTTPYQYTIDPTGTNGFQSSNVFMVLANSYTATVKDAHGCKTTATGIVTLNDTMRLSLSSSIEVCEGSAIILQPNTNPGTTVFSWHPGSTLSDSTIKNPAAGPSDTTKYYLTAQWGLCSRNDSITVNVLHRPSARVDRKDTTICFGTYAWLRGEGSSVSGPVNYLWTVDTFGYANGVIVHGDSSITKAFPDMSMNYILTVSDNYGCGFTAHDTTHVTVQPPVQAYAGIDTTAVTGVPQQLYASGGGYNGHYSWTWSPMTGAVVSDPNISNPVAILDNHVYDFYVTVTDSISCSATAQVRVTVYDDPTYYMPNAFSPNGDGVNDVFRPIPVGIVSTQYFRVFDRFGRLLFESSKFMDGWDGTYKGVDQPIGNYVYIIQGVNKFGNVIQKKGNVVLIR